jgi:hypothetical protein
MGAIFCFQPAAIETINGGLKRSADDLFHRVSHHLTSGPFEVETLNTNLVVTWLKTPDELKEASSKHTDGSPHHS